jgi:hypothetical protein
VNDSTGRRWRGKPEIWLAQAVLGKNVFSGSSRVVDAHPFEGLLVDEGWWNGLSPSLIGGRQRRKGDSLGLGKKENEAGGKLLCCGSSSRWVEHRAQLRQRKA